MFPSIRDQRNRLKQADIDGRKVLLDDNTTPRWALLWSHGYGATHHPKGWTFAHVWPAVRDPEAYTHPANIVMLPECLASLTDKDGPLCAYLRFHASDVYGWRPHDYSPIAAPSEYETIEWTYLPESESPLDFIAGQMTRLGNQRVAALRPLMGIEMVAP